VSTENSVACTAVPTQRLRDRRIKTAVSRQRIGKQVPATTNTHATIVTIRNSRSVRRDYKENNSEYPVNSELSSANDAEKKWRYSSVVG
jgi:hypothetical protein